MWHSGCTTLLRWQGMEYKLKFRCRTTPGQNIPPSRGLHCFELCFMDSHLLWTALPAFVSICSSLCCLHGLWILFLHRNTKPLQHSLVVWEKKRLIQFSQTGASWFVDTLYRGVRKKAEFSCSKNGNKMVGISKGGENWPLVHTPWLSRGQGTDLFLSPHSSQDGNHLLSWEKCLEEMSQEGSL